MKQKLRFPCIYFLDRPTWREIYFIGKYNQSIFDSKLNDFPNGVSVEDRSCGITRIYHHYALNPFSMPLCL
jgi:hypothetical protein